MTKQLHVTHSGHSACGRPQRFGHLQRHEACAGLTGLGTGRALLLRQLRRAERGEGKDGKVQSVRTQGPAHAAIDFSAKLFGQGLSVRPVR